MAHKKVRIAINGFGRIGRASFRICLERSDEIEVVAVNDRNPVSMLKPLLQYDTVYGRFAKSVEEYEDGLIVDGQKVRFTQNDDPAQLPWKELAVDVVLESTGVFRTREDASKHIVAGAKQVLISAPGKEGVPLHVRGVSENDGSDNVSSNASCTTNCISPVMYVLEQVFGIEKAMMSTIHAYTNDQNVLDVAHKNDPRRARAAALNIIPTDTGAATATAKVMPSLVGKFDGIAFRVPVAVGSLSDITVLLKKDATVAEINAAFVKAKGKAPLQGILETTTDPIVSSDIIGTTCSALVDLSLTNVVGGNLAKVVAWYDNEWGYSTRYVEMALAIGSK